VGSASGKGGSTPSKQQAFALPTNSNLRQTAIRDASNGRGPDCRPMQCQCKPPAADLPTSRLRARESKNKIPKCRSLGPVTRAPPWWTLSALSCEPLAVLLSDAVVAANLASRYKSLYCFGFVHVRRLARSRPAWQSGPPLPFSRHWIANSGVNAAAQARPKIEASAGQRRDAVELAIEPQGEGPVRAGRCGPTTRRLLHASRRRIPPAPQFQKQIICRFLAGLP
jgi:hypothetical protein